MADDEEIGAAPARKVDKKLMAGHSNDDKGIESIGVFARLKPCSGKQGDINVNTRFGKQKSVQARNLEFSLDWIFKQTQMQEEIYAIAGHDRVVAVLSGFNATIMAYGQTVSDWQTDPPPACFAGSSPRARAAAGPGGAS